MTEPDRARVRALFAQAADLPALERGAFLAAACHGQPQTRAEVESLLAYDSDQGIGDDDQGFLKSPIVRAPENTRLESAASPLGEEAGPPPNIGRYRILRLHGAGGMGAIYEAQQDNPRRTVALKVIRPGVLSPELVKRFDHEARILGRLQHPGIAQIHEAGMSAEGRPFLAMEFIHGMPLDEFARARALGASARLELIAMVCDAVQHAHDKGVIHRDLKPENILVEESGQPKVLDFGVAHVTTAGLLTTVGQTQAGQLLGTLSYMSPEQITADPAGLDGRSDVYTLGVLLFEVLANRAPYHLDQLPMPEVARVIQQEEPPRLGSVDATLRGDIEIIVAKALEKDRVRRYATAGDMASDIRRFLRGEAIRARPPSALYQLGKFARRHKALVIGTTSVFLALLAGTVVSILFALRAAANARAADEYAHMANERERVATYQSYRARVAAAVAALWHHDVVDAARQLDAAPEALRDWEWRHLRIRLDDSMAAFPAAAGEIQSLIHHPNGIHIAAWTSTGLRLTDLEGAVLLSRSYSDLSPHPPISTRRGLRLVASAGETADHDPDGALPSGRTTNHLCLLDVNGRVQTHLMGPPGGQAHRLAVSPDGTRMAVVWLGPKGWEYTLYDPDSGKPGATIAQNLGDIWDLVFSPDGKLIATAGEDGLTRLWDASTGLMTAQCRGHARKVLSVAFRPDGRRIVTTSADGTVRQWDYTTGREIEPSYQRHAGEVVTATYSPDGLWIASGGTDRTIRVWEATGRRDLAVLHGHTGVVSQLAFSADGRRLASASQATRTKHVNDGTARIWELGRQAGTTVLLGHTSYVYPVAFSADGQWIASGSWDKTVRLWDAVNGECCAILPHPEGVRALAFSPDGSRLFTGCGTGLSLNFWNLATARLERSIPGSETDAILALAASPDGTRIAAASAETGVRILEAATGAELHSLGASELFGVKKALAYSPDGKLVAGTVEDQTQVDLWDTRTNHRSARLVGHTGFVYSVAFSGDGRRLASAGNDRTVRVWDVAAANCIAVLTGHTDEVFAVAFHPDGKRLASAGRDRAVWLWDLATGQEVARLEGHTNYVFSLAFSPDGKSLVSGSGDGTVQIWDTEPPALRNQARREAEAPRPAAERLVARLFADTPEPVDVVARLRADQTLSEPLRRAALRAVMRRRREQPPGE